MSEREREREGERDLLLLTTIRVVPVLPDCATRPQDGPGAERERSEVTSLNKRLTIYPLSTCRRERERDE